MQWLDRMPLAPLAVVAILLALAPFSPEPHLWQKLNMLADGNLQRPVDIFDLFLHGTPLLVLGLKLLRLAGRAGQ
ncbi:MAG TPA: RND transporter [Gammaproteobacteria bacterium]|nr:RND transporter [Gammaproteobacteria bacterium]